LFLGFLIGSLSAGAMFYVWMQLSQDVKIAINPIEPNTPDTIFIEKEQEPQKTKRVENLNVVSNDTVLLMVSVNQNVDSGEYIVLRDKMLASRVLKIISKTKVSSSQASEVIIDRMSDDGLFNDQILVEFWESPIDYQGYRLNKTKLVLFGINPNENLEIINNHEGYLTIINSTQTFKVSPTEKYRIFTFE